MQQQLQQQQQRAALLAELGGWVCRQLPGPAFLHPVPEHMDARWG